MANVVGSPKAALVIGLALASAVAMATQKIVYVEAAQVEQLQKVVEIYKGDFKELPRSVDLLYERGLVRVQLKDYWGHPYAYRLTSTTPGFALYSTGKNGIDENGGGDDVVGWEKHYMCSDYGVNCANWPYVLDLVSFQA
jgi:hypothetical protein